MKKIFLKKIISISIISLFLMQMIYVFVVEPTITTAASDFDDVVVHLTVDSGITITTPADVTMAPNIGIVSDSSIGTVVWNVKTNHAIGYTLAVKASSAPAMVSGTNSFADYQTGAPNTWAPTASSYQFGYSAFGTDVTSGTWGTGSDCGAAGVPNNNLKYKGFTTTDTTIATRSSVTSTSGVDSTVCFAAEQNGVYAPSGAYTATITATATEI